MFSPVSDAHNLFAYRNYEFPLPPLAKGGVEGFLGEVQNGNRKKGFNVRLQTG